MRSGKRQIDATFIEENERLRRLPEGVDPILRTRLDNVLAVTLGGVKSFFYASVLVA
jgi:hypothetical protein